ncbi:hypothetical protein RRG08_005001 [Elysia crispata]|uniref:Uncharacterized protein n=1 Tax=Elysia crispata TaxID=231223 RepID=A0AAE0ZBU3_9GAST|nr:hypothetical protein RRG08_005001 [Elysia crispata]
MGKIRTKAGDQWERSRLRDEMSECKARGSLDPGPETDRCASAGLTRDSDRELRVPRFYCLKNGWVWEAWMSGDSRSQNYITPSSVYPLSTAAVCSTAGSSQTPCVSSPGRDSLVTSQLTIVCAQWFVCHSGANWVKTSNKIKIET